MASPQASPGADAVTSSKKAAETLSQFVARVLDQLSLSAWLPSGALVLAWAFVVQLGSALDETPAPSGPSDALSVALGKVADVSLGGGLLLIAAVIVLTMVTQAFSFEAIRVLEGYWGTTALAEWCADRRCNHYARVRRGLDRRVAELTASAWSEASSALAKERELLRDAGKPLTLTDEMSQILGAHVMGVVPFRDASDEEAVIINRVDWRAYSAPNTLRRLNNMEKRRRDLPRDSRVLPTRLGNVLRHYEDLCELRNPEQFVQENFDALPVSLQVTHDHYRTRLDLYCSMVVVTVAVTTVGLAAVWGEWLYWLGVVGAGVLAAWMSYRAAVASARAYGPLLPLIRATLSPGEAKPHTDISTGP